MLLGCVFLLGCAVSPSVGEEWNLIWEDDFDTLDNSKWDHEFTSWGGGNNEFQSYTNDPMNSYVRDGKLYIVPTPLANNTNPSTDHPYGEDFLDSGIFNMTELYGRCTQSENWGCYRDSPNIPPIMSARLRTFQRFSYKYGRAEIYAKMPVGDWLWPAIWMLPEDWVYGGWPLSGEIDIIESIGNPDLISATDNTSLGIDKMGSTLHWGAKWDDNKYHLTHATKYNETNNYGDFHLFVFEWDENALRFSVDGDEILVRPDPPINKNQGWTGFWDFGKPWKPENTDNPWTNGSLLAPFDQKFHFVLNVGVGGTNGFIPDNVINRGGASPKPWKNTDSGVFQKFWDARYHWYDTWEGEEAAMQVDWIRVYQKSTGQESSTTEGTSSATEGTSSATEGTSSANRHGPTYAIILTFALTFFLSEKH